MRCVVKKLHYFALAAVVTAANAQQTSLSDETLLSVSDELPLTTRDRVEIRATQLPELPLTDIDSRSRIFQDKPFSSVIDVQFERERTIGEAASRILRVIGYDLYISGPGVDPAAEALFARPLPEVHRTFRNVPIRDSLLSLIGPGFTLVVDHKRRAVSADLSPEQRRYLAAERLSKR